MGPQKHSLFSRLLTLLLSTVAPVSAGAQSWGRVVAVNVDATGTPPGAAAKTLTVGGNLIHKERIQTSAKGSTQVIFPDQSTLNIGSNSNIVIDEFVYDPRAGTGEMVASVTKGILRYIGGKISHTAGVTINTPLASIGIRGGIATLMLPVPADLAASDPNLRQHQGQQLVISHYGAITVTNHAGSTTIRPGFAVLIGSANLPIGKPFRPAGMVLQQVMNHLTSNQGQHGGVALTSLPTPTTPVPSGFAMTHLTIPSHPPGSDPLGYVSIFGSANGAARSRSQTSHANSTMPPPYP
jgi:hypothetical protein